jgi:anti-sigma factor RsiW
MNSTSLHALIVDQHCGELSPEVADLLESHLAQDAEARAEANRIRQTLSVTEDAVLRHPELARVETVERASAARFAMRAGFRTSWLAKAASIALLASLTGVAGYFFGKQQGTVPSAAALAVAGTAQTSPRKDSPWARYRVVPERKGDGIQVVRVDTANLDNTTLR